MKSRLIIPRALAKKDVDEAVGYYLSEGAEQAALGFIDALEQAYAHIGRHPASGSLRYAHELDLPGLRCWQLKRYPHVVFYIEYPEHIDLWRVLHSMRDISAWLRDGISGKGKAKTPFEFGAKVSIAATLKEGLVVGACSLPGNSYDGHTLPEALEGVRTHCAKAESGVCR